MRFATDKSAFLGGLRDGAPFILVVVPFALLFGVVARDAGLALSQVMGFSVLVIAGAAQYAALQMMLDDAAIPLVLLAALAVNLRMAMYSAALVPHLGAAPLWQRAVIAYANFDQTYVQSVLTYEQHPEMTVSQKAWYFLGVAALITPIWCAATAVGALAGTAIPPEYALDFIVPILFLAMVAPMLKSFAHLAAAATSVGVGLALRGLPSGAGLLIAAGCAMAVGAAVESWRARP